MTGRLSLVVGDGHSIKLLWAKSSLTDKTLREVLGHRLHDQIRSIRKVIGRRRSIRRQSTLTTQSNAPALHHLRRTTARRELRRARDRTRRLTLAARVATSRSEEAAARSRPRM
jgi:hypothetical protein